MKRHRNDQIDVLSQAPVAMTQGTAKTCAEKCKAPELQCVDYLDEWWLVGPTGVESLKRGWSFSTGAAEIAVGQWVGLQLPAAASTHRPGCRLELSSAVRAQPQFQGFGAFDSMAGHADGREEKRQQPKTGFLELGFPCM
jgi:hypothetical protein